MFLHISDPGSYSRRVDGNRHDTRNWKEEISRDIYQKRQRIGVTFGCQSFEAPATKAPSGDLCLERKSLVFAASEEEKQCNKLEVNYIDTPPVSVPLFISPIPIFASKDRKIRSICIKITCHFSLQKIV